MFAFQDVFPKFWRKEFKLFYCLTCEQIEISCPKCPGSSCNGNGCDYCKQAMEDFHKAKTGPEDYLNKEEKEIYLKAKRMNFHIYESLSKDENEIDWKKMLQDGKLSQNDAEIFKEFLKE